MHWCHVINLFHTLGKPDQAILRAAETCYGPLLDILEAHQSARVTVNMDGSLAERLERCGQGALLARLGRLAQDGCVELTGSACAGAVLPSLSEGDARDAINRNSQVNRRLLGEAYRPQGLFPPEMAYAPTIAPLAEELGFRWVLLDEIGHSGRPGTPRSDRHYHVAGARHLRAFFRDRSLSIGLTYGAFTSAASFMGAIAQREGASRFVITATEADVFALRREGPRRLLTEMLEQRRLPMLTLSELAALDLPVEEVAPVASSWSSWDTLQF